MVETKYGGISIVKRGQFKEGLIVETGDTNLICREYYKNKFKEEQVEDGKYELDFACICQKTTPKEKMKEIARQLGTRKFYIDEDVIEILEDTSNLIVE